jgi:hypothetical protein
MKMYEDMYDMDGRLLEIVQSELHILYLNYSMGKMENVIDLIRMQRLCANIKVK